MLARTIRRIKGPFRRPHRELELHGAHRPYLVADPEGREWVLKRLQHRGILAEAIGALVGGELGVPIPNFGYFDEDDIGRGWLSSYIAYANHWTRAQLDDLTNPEDLGRMLVLDTIIYNEDRNPDNILFEPLEDSDTFHLWTIDTESALAARPMEFASRHLKHPSAHALPNDLSLISLEATIDETIKLAQNVSDVALQTIVTAATDASYAQGGAVLLDALRIRCRNAREIVENYMPQLEGR